MNPPVCAKNAPNPLQFLFSPAQSARSIISSGKGIGWVLAIWALDFFFQTPFTVSRWVLRATESPVSGLTTLWSFFVKASLLPAVLAAVLGVLFYYSKRRTHQPWDVWNSMLVAGYCFTPHTMLVALSAWVGQSGFDSPWLLHHRGGPGSISDVQMLMRAVPIILYGWLCIREPSGEPWVQKWKIIQMIPLIVVLGALASTGQYIAQNQERARPLMQGDALPDFPIYDASGDRRYLQEAKGRILLIDIWATWCGPCVAAMPHLESLHQQFKNHRFELISLNVEPERSAEVKRFMNEKELSFPLYFDRGKARQKLMINLYPTLILVNEQGNIDSIYNGTLGLAGLKGDIQRLLKVDEPPR